MITESIRAEVIDKKDFKMPHTLYKYRDWNDDHHKRLITNREVYFASPARFKDEFDCKNPTRWDLLTDEEILNKYYQDSLRKHPEYTIEQRMDFAVYWANNTLVTDKDFVAKQEKETFEKFHDFVGVLSLTEHPKEFKMWEEYSNAHTGFCVGFDGQLTFDGIGTGGGPVQYGKELPIIHPSPKHSFMEQTILQIFNKLEFWGFEKEYRIYMFRNGHLSDEDRKVAIAPSAFKEIILGALMPQDVEQQLVNSIPEELNHIKIRKAHFENDVLLLKNYLEN
ncbi:DUF2971 domain-containing protein [Mucilaginibacter sp. OK098]|uniref:DUF2971 domain-containing protein n=1 Tax=Mucilaginibacter sp. OK098 TaxID=1855297 RepID=UPI000919AF23|nr:DUF2971 domain-containing protein [Mucilaginibacter sp. OK098]SHM90086.1 Protein of unknown function [Mucilaginibacter sp. OK098]